MFPDRLHQPLNDQERRRDRPGGVEGKTGYRTDEWGEVGVSEPLRKASKIKCNKMFLK